VNLDQLQQLAASVGFPDPALAAAVAMAESGGNPNAFGDAQFGGSEGLWQINLPSHPNYDPTLLFDPTYNAQAAFQISSGGTNWQPWTTFRTGAYLQFYSPPTPAPAPTAPVVTSAVTPTGVLLTAAGVLGIGLLTWVGYHKVRRLRYA
jgi:hypothetical protein